MKGKYQKGYKKKGNKADDGITHCKKYFKRCLLKSHLNHLAIG